MRMGLVGTVVVALVGSSCGDGPLPPISGAETGALRVSVTTSGVDPDSNGYRIQLGHGGRSYYLPVNGAATISGLPVGSDTLWLRDVASNCAAAGENPRIVSVSADRLDPDTLAFEVACIAATGVLVVATVTSGEQIDPDGYTLVVGSECGWGCMEEDRHPLGVNEAVTLERVPVGYHDVWLEGMARNCRLESGAVTGATVPSADTASISFSVQCARPGALQVSVATTGTMPDPRYVVIVRGSSFDTTAVVATNDTVIFADMPAGDYSVALDSVALNCTAPTLNPASASVPSADTAEVGFAVTCEGLGAAQLSITTTGVDLDGDGYRIDLSGERFQASDSVAVNGTATISGVPGGEYSVALLGVAFNCDVVSPNPATITVPSGGTAAMTVEIVCVPIGGLAVTVTETGSNADVYRVQADGTGLNRLTASGSRDAEPAWSPDGSRIAFMSTRAGNPDIYVMDATGSSPVRLTTNVASDAAPAWSPDGNRIAFTSTRDGNVEVYVMQADGSGVVRLTNSAGDDSDPAWSPDGRQIAFTSTRDGEPAIYVMNDDGSGATRLTDVGISAVRPAWSPDGSRLAYASATCWEALCFYSVYVMNADGSGGTRLPYGTDEWSAVSYTGPAWSPDGRLIAFAARHYDCGWFSCTPTYDAVEAMHPDGTRRMEITRNASEPAWRP